jgi:hypothetical protein
VQPASAKTQARLATAAVSGLPAMDLGAPSELPPRGLLSGPRPSW